MIGDAGPIGANLILATFVLFCRIAGCLMLAPGLSNASIPVQIRLLVTVAITLALAPLLIGQSALQKLDDDPIALSRLIVMESLIGVMIGTLGRLFFSALETVAVAAANFLGLVNPFGAQADPNEMMPPLATLVVLAATALIFAMDLHWKIISGLVASYNAIPIRSDFDPTHALREIGSVMGQAFVIAIRVASPFFLYSVITNFALALVNRVTPQVAVFFIGPPFIVAGGLTLLYFVIRAQLGEFMSSLGNWFTLG